MEDRIQSPYTIGQIVQIVGPIWTQLADSSQQIHDLGYDSRKVGNPKDMLFFALQARRDGHQFVRDAYEKGVRHFVVRADFDPVGLTGSNILAVKDTLEALQILAAHHRGQFQYPVIGITGSNGKTVVKEWLYQLLNAHYHIVRSPKSYNSQVGVALSLWKMSAQHNLAIIEAGISEKGEMARLEQMIRPTFGVLTNIGYAHDKGFASREEKLAEKLTLFKGADQLIFSPQYVTNPLVIRGRLFTWNMRGAADLSIYEQEAVPHQGTRLKALYRGKEISLLAPFTDAASLEDISCCWAVMLALGFDTAAIAEKVLRLQPVSMRLVLKQGINNNSILDDSYSNDLSSLRIALDFLKQQQQHPDKIVILSDIPVEERYQLATYQELAKLLQEQKINQLIGVGPVVSSYSKLFSNQSRFFPHTDALLGALKQLNLQDATILIKGARIFGFEAISKALVFQNHETSLEINLNALEHNLNAYKSMLHKNTKLMVMVKAFSYGSGSFEIANLLQFNKVDYLTVAYVDEGVTLRRAGITLPIVVMSPGFQDLDLLIQYQLEPEIYSYTELTHFLDKLVAYPKRPYSIHIKVDTGMHRLGFDPNELSTLLQELKKASDSVVVSSVFSHLVASGDPQHDVFTDEQIDRFMLFTEALQAGLGYTFIRHIANTSAITRFPRAQFDMVRLGIGLYGITADEGQALPLIPIAQLKTGITQIKQIKAGETIGYNRHGRLVGDGTIATVKIGYADGYNRRFGNGIGKMRVNGHLVPTVGDICMDMCMLDITGVEAREGDEVLVIGEELRVEDLAKSIGTIPYELLTGISQRVRRIYFYE